MHSLRTALVLTLTAAAAAVVPAGAAVAAGPPPGQSVADALPAGAPTGVLPAGGLVDALPTRTVTGALAAGVAPVKNLTLDPLANTGVDPLDNAVGSQIADFQPVSTAVATGPVTHGASLGTLPVVGTVAALLPG